MRSIEYHSQSGLRVGGFQERENVLSLFATVTMLALASI